ncbi:acyl-CoA reductase-like NAD-dependent aldehyde dehydrogenase [Aneurinibacillus soli]|uniref:Succinate-semialdehyde dehydrogenase [NADP(+)] GabD n=1 Tax=Aneurinibacillus soli TaxID=1500254 RepID=A0A0U4NLZ8_9BACL|nr:aldehyde dehydrogenase family protein [Aneurinibacillus soli]PYE61868.1 acyl-CoA reductase-like NAD-dependent aldehyde dehydrogenase [Aneurinibacillus soli]BAU29684.1 Succinate-semialdehyde dehydrogenase [NADP(+)] GabD [Aneurinibacillus soli]
MTQTVEKKHLYLAGEKKEASSYKQLRSPHTGEVIADVAVGTRADMKKAIDHADIAAKEMAKMPAHRRAAILQEVSRLLAERKEEAARILALEAAKPITVARGEIARTVETYQFAADEARRLHGETIPLDASAMGENRVAYTVREPLGVVGAITPFNFPFNLVAHKLGPAFAAGNVVVLKPADQTPLSSYFIADLFEEAGLPAGALQVIPGPGSEVGDELTIDPRVKLVTFTGSPEVGTLIRQKAGLKRVVLELGSNSGLIIDEGYDIDRIVKRTVTGAFTFMGQVCISLQRIYVHRSLYDAFVEKFVVETNNLRIGDPLDESTDISALISQRDVDRIAEWVDEAHKLGARVLTGGTEGSIVKPTVIVDVPPHAKVSCQETFAPVVVISPYDELDEAIDAVNDSRFGLQAGFYTNDIERAFYASDRLEVGGVMINDFPTFRVDQMPYGGVKESGMGREGIKYATEEMTEMKLICFNRNR